MRAWILFLILMFCISVSCHQTQVVVNNEQQTSRLSDGSTIIVRSGIVLGNINVSEYRREVEIRKDSSNYQILDREGNILRMCKDTEAQTEWTKLLTVVNFEAFRKLPPIYCPNCPALGDIGYEWIEIQKDSATYRVLFQTDSDVTELSEILKIVRSKRDNFNSNCR